MEIKKGIDCVGVTIVYYCHDGKGNFVMTLRGQNCRDERGVWDLGGGGLEWGDTVEGTLRKEIKEEYCADVLEFEFLGYRDMHREENGQKSHWVALDFKVRLDPAQVKNGEPHKFDEVRWFQKETMPKNLHSGTPIIFEKYKERL